MRHLLRVNLTEGAVETEEVPRTYRDKFISGKGLDAAMLLDELEARTDPLSPKNKMVFVLAHSRVTHRGPPATVS